LKDGAMKMGDSIAEWFTESVDRIKGFFKGLIAKLDPRNWFKGDEDPAGAAGAGEGDDKVTKKKKSLLDKTKSIFKWGRKEEGEPVTSDEVERKRAKERLKQYGNMGDTQTDNLMSDKEFNDAYIEEKKKYADEQHKKHMETLAKQEILIERQFKLMEKDGSSKDVTANVNIEKTIAVDMGQVREASYDAAYEFRKLAHRENDF
jgi:hypothetical protein